MEDNRFKELLQDNELRQQLKALVLGRISVMPEDMRLAIGTTEITKTDIVKHVEDEDELGQEMIEMEIEYLRDLASGAIYQL